MVEEINAGRTAAALLLAASLCSCSSPPPDSSDSLRGVATVSVDGRATGERFYIRCSKVQWLLTIETGDRSVGFSAIINTADGGADAEVVKIRDVGGFTGTAWNGGVGELSATRDPDGMNIEGTGYGYYDEDAHRPATANFSISAAC